jgi:hypothetical protein
MASLMDITAKREVGVFKAARGELIEGQGDCSNPRRATGYGKRSSLKGVR